jgi:hypothetical protein
MVAGEGIHDGLASELYCIIQSINQRLLPELSRHETAMFGCSQVSYAVEDSMHQQESALEIGEVVSQHPRRLSHAAHSGSRKTHRPIGTRPSSKAM